MTQGFDVRTVSEHCARLRLDAPPKVWRDRAGAEDWHNPEPCELVAEERLTRFGWSCGCECHDR